MLPKLSFNSDFTLTASMFLFLTLKSDFYRKKLFITCTMPGRGMLAELAPCAPAGALNKMAEDTAPDTPWDSAASGGIWRTTCCGTMLRTWPWATTWRQAMLCRWEATQWRARWTALNTAPHSYCPSSSWSNHHLVVLFTGEKNDDLSESSIKWR